MKSDELDRHMAEVATRLRKRAAWGLFDGTASALGQKYLDSCRVLDRTTGTVLLFTRDTGHHTSGWFKNPQFERCLHLSLSALPAIYLLPGTQRAELDKKTEEAWARAVLQDAVRYAWLESPKTDFGKAAGVKHWRVFCNEVWEPFSPRGEVYSRELTEKGWKSASELGVEILTAPGVDPT